MYTITITITGHWLWDVHGDSFFLFHWNEFRKSSGNLFRQGKKLSFASVRKHNFLILSLNEPLKEYIFWIILLYFELHQQQKIYLQHWRKSIFHDFCWQKYINDENMTMHLQSWQMLRYLKYFQLKLLIIAIELTNSDGKTEIAVNPS